MSDVEEESGAIVERVAHHTMDVSAGFRDEATSNGVSKHATELPASGDAVTVDSQLYGYAVGDLDLDEVNDNQQDYTDDNLSLEVNFGDGSSCRASDVSSLSFQNIALDDSENPDSDNFDIPFRRGSVSDSSDSPLNDLPNDDDEKVFSGQLEEEIKRKESVIYVKSDAETIADEEECDTDSTNTGTMKRRNKLGMCGSSPTNSERMDDFSGGGGGGDNGGGCGFASTNTSYQSSHANGCDTTFQGEKKDETSDSKDTAGGDENECGEEGGGKVASENHNVVLREKKSTERHGKKRNSLEVRNNIPDISEVKRYDDDNLTDLCKLPSQPALAKIKKKSPGLARRLADSSFDPDRDTSSSEKEMDQDESMLDTSVLSAQKEFESQLRIGSAPSYAPSSRLPASSPLASKHDKSPSSSLKDQPKSDSFEKLCDSLLGNDAGGDESELSREDYPEKDDADNTAEPLKNVDIENEYDYVKYARIQTGDSYVGMRLAYSSDGKKQGSRSSDDEHYFGSSREASPQKATHKLSNVARLPDQLKVTKVNEETLTEIPLNNSTDQLQTADRNFSLSPEATECDSAEVESVLSEEGKSSTSGMPVVEDGLSSSQASDTEDPSTHELQLPAEILKQRYKRELFSAGIHGDEDHQSTMSVTTDNSSSLQSTPSHGGRESQDDSQEDVDQVIREIKAAMQRSKNYGQDSDHSGSMDREGEPVWVMR